ncbi:MAG: cytochrome c3 family protein [Steroidobacterales bacterium]
MKPRTRFGWMVLTAAALALLVQTPASAAAAAAGAAPITVSFDHLTTGFELDGVHRDLPCEACHLNAVFRGTPLDCGSCHITGSPFNATPKTATHIPSTNNCAACHNTISFRPDVHFDHAEVLGSCVSCHNGTIAQGEGPTHPATSQDCGSCHTVISWNPTKAVDHSQIPLAVQGFCIVCHNGVQAAGKPAGHVVTNQECGDCHTTTSWLGASFDHTGITSGCFSCHNGTKAVGKQGNHMPTSNLCENCHTTGIGTKTPSWTPSAFDHTQMAVTTCQTCHSGRVKISTGVVSGQPTNHVPPIPSAIDCGVCHGNTPTAETWAVLAASIPTLHSGLPVSNCLLCHAGQTFAGVPAPYIPMSISGVSPTHATALAPPHIPILAGVDCSSCHAAAYQSGGFGPATAMSAAKHAFVATTCMTCHETGRSYYTGGGTPLQLRPADHLSSSDSRMVSSDCSLCHTTTDWSSTLLPVGHMPNPGNQGCSVCHTAAPSNYTTLASNAVLHTGISGGCGQCHGATSTLTFFNNFTVKSAVLIPAHIPLLSGTDCSSCHSTTTYAVGGFGGTTMSAAKHAFVATTCDLCHEANLTFYPGAALNLQGRPADHIASSNPQMVSGDCSGCHSTTNWNTTALPAGHMPNPAAQACTVCHTAAPANYTTLAANPVLHTGISSGCNACHGSTTALTFYNNFTPKSAVLSPAHIPLLAPTTPCEDCHSPTVFSSFSGTTMSAATHAFVASTCNTCHEAGRSFYPGAALNLQGRPADHTSPTMAAPNDCGGCHTTANWNSGTLPAGHMPNPGNQACLTCHTAAPANYATLASNAVLHTGISSGCITCHGSPAGALTFYNNFTPKSAVLAPVHIPTATTPCEDCHSAAVFTAFSGATMNSAKHTLMFAFIGSTCDACHNRVTPPLSFYGVSNLQTRPGDHNSGNMASADCSRCHSPNDWGGGTQRRPANATASPTATTASTTATRQVPRPMIGTVLSVPVAPSAGATSTSFGVIAGRSSATSFSHSGVAGSCVSCHNGVAATGKAPTHIASNERCENCHTTIAWLPARFDHQGVSARCASCHNAVSAAGKPVYHVPTNEDCSACHGTIAWLPARFSHAQLAATCQSCHNGLIAAGKPLRHVATTLDCGSCHNTTTWTTIRSPTPQHSTLPAERGGRNGPGK